MKNQAAIGHLLKCPKCGGMVMIKAPEDRKPGDSANLRAETAPAIQKPIRPADAQDTLGENQDFAEIDALLAASAPKGMPPAGKGSGPLKAAPAKSPSGPVKASAPGKAAVKDRPSRFAEGEPAANGAISGAAANGKAAHAQAAPPVPGSEVVPLPSANWPAERPVKYWLFLGVSILLGMGLAFGVVAVTLSYFGEDTSVAVNPEQNPGETKPAQTSPSPGTETTGANKTETPGKTSTSTPDKPTEKTETKAVPAEKGKTEDAKSPAPMTEEDPLGIGKKPAETKTKPPLANDPFSKFDRIVGEKDPAALAPAPAVAAPKPAETVPEGPVKPALPRPPARLVNIATRMNDPLPGLHITADEVPLADFLQLMQDFSTIPITLEPDNLVIFGQSASTPLGAYEGENLKFGQALTAVLKTMGLEAAVEDEQIIVRKPELFPDKTRELKLLEFNYPVGDLTREDEKLATELATRIMALVEPASWGDDDDEKEEPKADEPKSDDPKPELAKKSCFLIPGKKEFSVRQRLSAQVQILTLFEKLRVARGGAPAGKKIDPSTFKLDTRTQQAAARLAAPISLTFNRPTPLVKICQKLSADGKMRILIDWRSIASAGWNPDAELTLVVDKKPLSETLAALVEPMDLAYRVVDGRTIQIVSPQYFAEHLELEFHPAKELVSSPESIEPLLARVRASLSEGAEPPAPGQIWLDAESKCLITMLPQPKQQLLTRLLADWRTKETN